MSFRSIWKWLRWATHPISIFVFLQIVWITITLLWVIWFVDAFEGIAKLAKNFGTQHFDARYALIIMVVGCVLLGMLLVGTVVLFIFGQRQAHLINQQKNFLSSVTHELRSPLASLKLTIETMQMRKLDEVTSLKLCSMALVDIERLAKLVSQILVSARLDRGIEGFQEEAETLALYDLILKTAQRVTWLDKNIMNRLQISCHNDLRVHMPQAMLSLMLSNLLENAIKYSPMGSPIFIQASRQDGNVEISVKDEGIGLSEKDKHKIFKMFYRTKQANQNAVSGTGLGLFIVRSLARVLGGKAWVESEGENKGATFYIKLPLKT